MTAATEDSPNQAQPFMGDVEPTELLDLLIDEAAASLALLSDFQLGEPVLADVIEHDRPVWEEVHIVFRIGFAIKGRARMGLLGLTLPEALTLSGFLLMLPTDSVAENRSKSEPNEGDKEAIMEAGNLIAGAFRASLSKRVNGSVDVQFFGCQGVAAGEPPWISGFEAEALAIRQHSASFAKFDTFSVVMAIPV